MGAFTTAAAIGVTLASGVMQYQQGRQQQATFKQQAKLALKQGEIKLYQQQQKANSIRKQALANIGRGGTLTGSALEQLNQSTANALLDAESIKFNSIVQAENYFTEGRNARAAGTTGLLSSVGQAAMIGASAGIGKSTGLENMGGGTPSWKPGQPIPSKPPRQLG